jgi:CMP/dCMP kinase
MKKINIAIDGHAGCGKSTTAKGVARRLGYLFIDSGAMYRAVTLHLLREGVDFAEETPAFKAAVEQVKVDFFLPEGGGHPEVQLNGEKVEAEIRQPQVSAQVSQVARHPSVREVLVREQQRISLDKGVVMDGRDIGTVVLPQAELKVYMTAAPLVRAQRRQAELAAKGIEQPLEEILANLQERDRIDSSRPTSPLRQAEDAIVIDTSGLTIEQQIDQVVALATAKWQAL